MRKPTLPLCCALLRPVDAELGVGVAANRTTPNLQLPVTHSLMQSLASGSIWLIHRKASLKVSPHRLHLFMNFWRWKTSFHTSYDCRPQEDGGRGRRSRGLLFMPQMVGKPPVGAGDAMQQAVQQVIR